MSYPARTQQKDPLKSCVCNFSFESFF